MKVLVTGSAGFIGYHIAHRLLELGAEVIGLDNLNDYYDVRLKQARLDRLTPFDHFHFERIDLSNSSSVNNLFQTQKPDRVIHMAAQAGVRYSLECPHTYLKSNLEGFLNILEGCRHFPVNHLIFASSSSVYGSNAVTPFSEHHNVDHPLSLYAASKKANELMAHSYAHLYGLPCTGLRFFTVYGPWGRPDMSAYLFIKAILENRPIEVFNHGHHKRDFTYIDDVVEGILRIADLPPGPNPAWPAEASDPATSSAPYRIYNIGHNRPIELLKMIGLIEKEIGQEAIKIFLPIQPGDVPATCADIDDLFKAVGFRPSTPIEEGIRRLVQWYREYYVT